MKKDRSSFKRSLQQHRQIVERLSPSQGPAKTLYQDFPSITLYRPLYSSNSPLPTVLYIPGNAFTASETGYTHFICSHIAEQSQCQLIVIKHALAPENQFPIGFNNIKNTFNFLLSKPKNPFGIQIDKSRLAIVGYSSGGNFAALMTIEAKKMHIPVARQMLISPITDLSRSLRGFEQFEQQDTAITEQFVKWFLDLYIPKNIARTNPKISPYWAKNSALHALPPTDIIFGELDRFRSDAELYGNKLNNAGNIVHSLMWNGENHGALWKNHKVINMIASRLAVTFGTESISKPLKPAKNTHEALMIHHFKSKLKKREEQKHCISARSPKFFPPLTL